MIPRFWPTRLIVAVAVLWTGSLPIHCLLAQEQERGILDRINKPDLSMGYSPAQKKFDGFGAAQSKSFSGRGFAFSKSAHVKAFRTKDVGESKSFRTRLFAAGDREAAGPGSFAGRDRAFSARAVPVREAAGAQKALPVRTALAPGEQARPFLGRGKRQDLLDEQSRERKPLTIEEVRELLNKSR